VRQSGPRITWKSRRTAAWPLGLFTPPQPSRLDDRRPAPAFSRMGKATRHTVIRELIQTHRIGSQEQLREVLHGRGFDVAQATLSRDVRELRLIKVAAADGRLHYTLPPEALDHKPPLHRLLPTLFVGAEGTGNLLIVKTFSGGAQAVAEALDWEEWPEVLGSVAGDNTILLVLRDAAQLATIQRRIEDLAGEP
jgi:transcriptional regulator of arginine metabolism